MVDLTIFFSVDVDKQDKKYFSIVKTIWRTLRKPQKRFPEQIVH